MRFQVDRHVRLLDQAIKEQEASITLGLRPGTQPAPIAMSESNTLALSKFPDAGGDEDEVIPPENTDHLHLTRNKGREHWRARLDWTAGKGAPSPPAEVPDERTQGGFETALAGGRGRKKKRLPPNLRLRLTVAPSTSIVLANGDMPIDPHEPRYCYCNQVSWGEVSYFHKLNVRGHQIDTHLR